jgi:class 3 adenylate cyclase/tetratricopeptide (TPR) repeat protein/ribosomal protein L40E
MLCPQCRTENPDQAKFCLGCGTKLAVVCPVCGATLPPQAKFCFECGTQIGATPPPEPEPAPPVSSAIEGMAERLQRLIPKEFAERLLAARGKMEGERRIVTMLFSDVKGSTAMAEDMDPEDVMEIMDGAFDILIEPIYQHEGTLARLMGDAILAFFGAPIAHENDPERAIRAALEIVEGAKAYAERLERERGVRGFSVRVGINTGLVVVGEVGSDLRAEYTAMGDAVNLASRMEQNAPVGGILISHDTYSRVRGLFDVQALEPIAVKGKREPVRVYLVQRAKPRAFRVTTRGVEGVETPMIGREKELQQLQDAFHLAHDPAGGGCQVVTITGEAGVGKSRLLYEFEDWLELLPDPVCYLKGRASQEMRHQPYALIRDLLAMRLQVQDSDPTDVVREKIEKGISEALGKDTGGQMKSHFVGQLLGFDFSGSPHLQGVLDDAQQLHDRGLIYLSEFLGAAAALEPTVAFLEDIHWADDSSLDTTQQLAARLSAHRLLMVCLARPLLFERRPHWDEGQAIHRRLELDPLSEQDSRLLVKEILHKVEDIPDTLRQLVVNRAEGNPLYVEELIKMLIEDGVILKGDDGGLWRVEPSRLAQVRVPPTLVGVLQARLDSLAQAEQITLQRASVVGRTFWDRAVAQISESSGEQLEQGKILGALDALGRKELVFSQAASAFAGAHEYAFKHAILREVAYGNILKRVRRLYHGLVAEWLIDYSGERADEYAGLIAEHLEAAREIERAIVYLHRAGQQAAAQFANAEAVNCFSQALKLLEQAKWEMERIREERYALLLEREGIHGLLGERQAQTADLNVLKALAEKMDDDRRRAEVALRHFGYYQAISDYPVALTAAQEAVRWAEAASDVDQRIEGLIDWGIILWRQGTFEESSDRLDSARALLQEHSNQSLEAKALLNLGIVSYFVGDYQKTLDHWEQALSIRRALGERRGEALCLSNLVAIYDGLGDLAKAKACAQQALATYQTIGDRQGEADALANLAGSLRALGDLTSSRERYEHALDLYRAIGDRKGEALALKTLGLTLHDLGDRDAAGQYCKRALTIEQAIGDRRGEAYSLTYMALTLEGLGELEEAAIAHREALDLRREIGQFALSIDNLAGLARLEMTQGQAAEALEYVEEILAWLAAHGVDGIEDPLRVYVTAADILNAAGQEGRAAEALAAAQTLMQDRAARISDEADRSAFLERVPVHHELRERLAPKR